VERWMEMDEEGEEGKEGDGRVPPPVLWAGILY